MWTSRIWISSLRGYQIRHENLGIKNDPCFELPSKERSQTLAIYSANYSA